MKKMMMGLIFIFLISFASAQVRINEIESNPEGSDSGNEWVELYSDTWVDLSNWKIVNSDGEEILLTGAFYGNFVIKLDKRWLDNSDEEIFLYNGENLIDETGLLSDSQNDGRTWQYCPEEWKFLAQSPGWDNSCGQTSNPDVTGRYGTPDGIVNIIDFLYVRNRMRKNDLTADVNNDLVVNVKDLMIVRNNFGRVVS